MAVRTIDEILDITRRIRSGEIVDEELSTVLIDIVDTVTELSNSADAALSAADIANAAARAAKEANVELYSRLTASQVESEAEVEEPEIIEYEDIFESEDK